MNESPARKSSNSWKRNRTAMSIKENEQKKINDVPSRLNIKPQERPPSKMSAGEEPCGGQIQQKQKTPTIGGMGYDRRNRGTFLGS